MRRNTEPFLKTRSHCLSARSEIRISGDVTLGVSSMKVLLRRSPYLVFYWEGRGLFIQNYLTHVKVAADPLVLRLLDLFERPRSASDLVGDMATERKEATLQAIDNLMRHTLLEIFDSLARARERAMRPWNSWGVEARLFHLATKDVNFIRPEDAKSFDEARKCNSRAPSAFKRYSRAQRIDLPPAKWNLLVKFTDVLKARRTQRDFDGRSITLKELSTLLGLTWGVSKWVNSSTFGQIGLGTSPSGGARYPIEVYVSVHNVRGLRQGLYHYSRDRHQLHVLHLGRVKNRAEAFCAGQWWTRYAGALFIMTALFERTMWLYGCSRALRNIYLEAGHLCQTFCLTATALNLAPFCTAALADSMIEREIGLDGIRESVLYVAAAGRVRSISVNLDC